MITDEVLFRLLQFSSGLGCITLLITCMSMQDVKWWLPLPIYALSMMCMVTFLTTFFMRRYTFEVAVVTLFVLAVSSTATAIHGYIRPRPGSQREALNRQVLFWTLPIIGVLLTIWCVGVAYEGGIGFFERFDQKLSRTLDNQVKILARQDSTDKNVYAVQQQGQKTDSTSSAYRTKLDQDVQAMRQEMVNFSLRLHRLSTDNQKRKP